MKNVYQIAGCLTPGDAVSNYVLYLGQLLNKEGYRTRVFADVIAPDYAEICLPIHEYWTFDSPDSYLFAHYSIASPGLLGLIEFTAKKLLFYHNVTPYEYWRDINTLAAFHCLRGKADLARIVPHVDFGFAFSEFSRRDLVEAGLQKTAVVPLTQDIGRLQCSPDPVTLGMYPAGAGPIVLMVGRVVPNKKIEDGIRTVSLLPDARLIVAGSWETSAVYYYALRDLATSMKVRCEFTGPITQSQLTAYYQLADVLLVLSEHEGFCAPILEAFYYNLPVVAVAAGAIPETAKTGAILFHDRNPLEAAALIARLLEDSDLRSYLQQQGQNVLRQHLQFPVKETLLQSMAQIR